MVADHGGAVAMHIRVHADDSGIVVDVKIGGVLAKKADTGGERNGEAHHGGLGEAEHFCAALNLSMAHNGLGWADGAPGSGNACNPTRRPTEGRGGMDMKGP